MEAKELFQEAQLLFIQGKHKESTEAFTRAIEAGADPFISYLSRGAACLKMDEAGKAIEDFSRAIEANQHNARVYYYRGAAYLVNEDYEKAAADFSRTIEMDPDHGAALLARGECYAQLEMDEEAVRDIKDATVIAETAMQSFANQFGIIRTHFDGIMALLSDEKSDTTKKLSEKETGMLKKWLDEEGQGPPGQ